MKIIFEVDLENKESKILSIGSFSSVEIIEIICKYFNTSMEDLVTPPLKRSGDHLLIRKFCIYFLINKKDRVPKIARLLGYDTASNVTELLPAVKLEVEKSINEKHVNKLNKLLNNYIYKKDESER